MREKTKNLKFETIELVSLDSNSPKNLKPSVRGGFSVLSRTGKRIISMILGLMVIAGGLFFATAPANAGPLEDWTCDSYRTNLYKDYGAGTTHQLPEVNPLNLYGSFVDLESGNYKLTAYEMYGTAGTNYSMWYSVDRENIGTHTYEFLLPNADAPVNDSVVPKPGGSGSEGESNFNPYWANNWVDCVGLSGAFGNGIANYMLNITEMGTVLINFTYTMAVDGYKFATAPILDTVESIVKTLNTSLYLPFIIVFIMFGALWLAWKGLVKRASTEAFQGAIWMIGSTIAGIMLIAAPGFIPSLADDIVGTTTEVATTAVTDAGLSSDKDNVLCSIDTSDKLKYTDEDKNDLGLVSAASRKMQCAIWHNLVYMPWVTGQFGVSPTSTEEGAEYIIGSSVDTDAPGGQWVEDNKNAYKVRMGEKDPIDNEDVTWPLLQLNAQAYNLNTIAPTAAKNGNQYWMSSSAFVAYNELAVNENTQWNGSNPLNRVTVANTSVVAMGFTAVLVLTFSILIIVYQLMMLFLILMMPFFLLVGAHPGYGRRVATRWAELIVNLIVKRMVIAVLLAVFLMFYGIIMSTSTIWLLQNILIAAITIVGLIYRKKITDIFANIDFGGDKSIGNDANSGRPNLLKRAAGAAIGAGVAVAGAKIGMSSMKPSEAALAGATKVGTGATNAAGNAVKPAANAPAVTVANNDRALPVVTTVPAGPDTNKAVGAPVNKVEAAKAKAEADKKAAAAAATLDRRNKEEARIAAARKSAIRSAAVAGAAQGASGNIGSAALGAAMVGHQIGDGAYDNEVQLQQNESMLDATKGENNGLPEDTSETDAISQAREEDFNNELDSYVNMPIRDAGTPSGGRHAGNTDTGVPTTSISDSELAAFAATQGYSTLDAAIADPDPSVVEKNKEQLREEVRKVRSQRQSRAVPTFEVTNREDANFVRAQQERIRKAQETRKRYEEAAQGRGPLADAARAKVQETISEMADARDKLDGFRKEQTGRAATPRHSGAVTPPASAQRPPQMPPRPTSPNGR